MRFAMIELKVETLKDKQKEAICSFVNGRDCFVILLTGYSKTLCYVLLPYVFDLTPSFVETQEKISYSQPGFCSTIPG